MASVIAMCSAAEPPITALAFAPDGTSVVTGSQAGLAVHTWPTLELLRTIDTQLINIHDVEFAPDGRTLAVAGGTPSEFGMVEMIHWPAGTSSGEFRGHDDCVLDVAWNGRAQFATAGLDHAVVLWNTNSREPVQRFTGHSGGVTAVCFLTNASMLVSAGRDQNVRVWNLSTGQLLRTLNNHTDGIHELVRRPGTTGQPMLASVSDDRTVRLWQPTIGRMVRFAYLQSAPLAVDWLPDGSRMVVTTVDGHVVVINPDTVEVTRSIPAVDGWGYALQVHPTDGSLAVGGRHGQLRRISL